jgi:acetolactate synthase I/II/III large subunit
MTTNGATRMTGGAALVKSIRQQGIDTLFGIPGVQLDCFFNALYDEGNAIRMVHSRHEQGAGYLALGYAQASGRPAVYAVVPGAGFLNAAGALSTAYACNAPVLCVTGQAPSDLIGRQAGAHHEIPDQLATMRGLTKWADRVRHPAEAPATVNRAFTEMLSGRKRPVALEMAPDVMASEAAVTLREAAVPEASAEPDPDAVAEAAKLLAAAKRPLILSGGGTLDASAELLAVAEMLQAPVCMSRNGKGVVSSRRHLGLTESEGHQLWADADVVLAVGTRMFEQYRGWGVDRALKVIRIEVDAAEMTRHAKPDIGILSDAKAGLAALATALPRHLGKVASREEELTGLKGRMQAEYRKLQPQMGFIDVLREELPDDGIVVSESTQLAYMARIAMPFYAPRQFISPGYQGTLGFGFPTALGCKVAKPDCQVISISGDGGFLFAANELATAVQHGIGTVTIVVNDGAYGNVRRMQVHKYGGRVIGTELRNPDFVKYAESFGAQGLRATDAEGLRGALRKGFAHDGPTVIEIPVGELPSPWHFMHLKKLR